MTMIWSPEAQADVRGPYLFLASHDIAAADPALDRLVAAPQFLLDFAHRGSRLSEFDPREVREFWVDRYLLRYELADRRIFVLRFVHAREER